MRLSIEQKYDNINFQFPISKLVLTTKWKSVWMDFKLWT